MSESPEEKYNRLQREIQRAILHDYPNPERRGCPADEVVERFARNPGSIRIEDELDETSNWYHVTHCSPCYATYLEAREAASVRAIDAEPVTRRAIIATSVMTAAAVSAGWFFLHSSSRVQTVELDLDANAAYRGEAGSNQKQSRLEIPRGRLRLTLRLPQGRAAGLYSVQIRNARSDDLIFATTAASSFEHGFQIVRFDVHLRVSSGPYTLAVRNDHRDVWRYYSVSIT